MHITIKSSTDLPLTTLNDGTRIPMLAFGTSYRKAPNIEPGSIDPTIVSYIETALSLGYIHLDTAELYNSEPEVGLAIKESGIPREKLYITTKVINNIDNIEAGIDASLEKLGVDYVDLYLIHTPWFTTSKKVLQKAWKDMENVKASGKAKSVSSSEIFIKEEVLTNFPRSVFLTFYNSIWRLSLKLLPLFPQ